MKSNRFVTESMLNYEHFRCCGDEDLYPFKCSHCGHIMVFCYECDTLYSNLKNLSTKFLVDNSPDKPIFPCPICGHLFEYHFMRNEEYKVTVQEWMNAGYQHLLATHNPSLSEDHPQ